MKVAVIGLGSIGPGNGGFSSPRGDQDAGYDVAHGDVERFAAMGREAAFRLTGWLRGAEAVVMVC